MAARIGRTTHKAAQIAFNYLYAQRGESVLAYEVKAAILLGTFMDRDAIYKKVKELENADKVEP